MRRLFKQFSFPGGIPSHVAPVHPGSIHEGGELGYSLSHSFGGLRQPGPDRRVRRGRRRGDRSSRHELALEQVLNPATNGAVLPILHLNGYKIANPTVLAHGRDQLEHLLRGYGYTPYFVEGHEPESMHRRMAATLDQVVAEIRGIGRPRTGRHGTTAVADDCSQDAQGVDRAQGGRWCPGGRDLPSPPGPVVRADRASRRTSRSLRPGCAATGPKSSSTSKAG